MVDTNKLENCMNSMIELLMEMKRCLKEDGSSPTSRKTLSNPDMPQRNPVRATAGSKPTQLENDISNSEQLKLTARGKDWPDAVNKNLICDPNSESDKNERGRGVIELMIEEDLKDIKFLDFGCGEGHCAFLSSEYKTTASIGYDIKSHDKWHDFERESNNILFTTTFDDVQHHGPYDVILIFDVIDHVENESMESLLRKAESVLADSGKIYLRCHPFTSRHATHLYHDLNKAYLHLIFSPDELRDLVPHSVHELNSTKVTRPLATYGAAISGSGLMEINRREITEKVEPFFTSPEIANRINKSLEFDKFPNFQLSLQFIDYVLGKKKDSEKHPD